MLNRSEGLAVVAHLEGFLRLFDELIALLQEKRTLSPIELTEAKEKLRYLKKQLKLAAKHAPANAAERAYFGPAVQKAAANISAAVNTVPIRSNWFSNLYAVRMDISHPLSNLKRQLGEEAT